MQLIKLHFFVACLRISETLLKVEFWAWGAQLRYYTCVSVEKLHILCKYIGKDYRAVELDAKVSLGTKCTITIYTCFLKIIILLLRVSRNFVSSLGLNMLFYISIF